MTLGRAWNGIARRLLRVRFGLRNRLTRRQVAGGSGPVVTLTTHGSRVAGAYLGIESIAHGRIRPRRLILWLGDQDARAPLPPPLARLVVRGLEVRSTRDLGPHTKYSALAHEGVDGDFVTADDDVFYPRRWLADLVHAAGRAPGTIVCHRAHVVVIDHDSGSPRIAPYVSWPPCSTTAASPANFATGVSGVLYPGGFAAVIRAAGTGFTAVAPRADDVWLHALALASGHRVAQVRSRPAEFLGVPGTRPSGLYRTNEAGGNDRQIAATYTAEAVRALAECETRHAARSSAGAAGAAAG